MKKAALCIILAIGIHSVVAQKTSPSLRLKAYQTRSNAGSTLTAPQEPTYYIYLLANKVPYLKIERVWINNQLYLASIDKINEKPVVLDNGTRKDTLVKYTDEMVWQVKIKGKDQTGITPKKDIEDQVKANELVLRLVDQNDHVFTRTAKQIAVLEAGKGQ